MRSVHHIELCLEEASHELTNGSVGVSSIAERIRLAALISEARALLREVALRQGSAAAAGAMSCWIAIAIQSARDGHGVAPAAEVEPSRAADANVAAKAVTGAWLPSKAQPVVSYAKIAAATVAATLPPAVPARLVGIAAGTASRAAAPTPEASRAPSADRATAAAPAAASTRWRLSRVAACVAGLAILSGLVADPAWIQAQIAGVASQKMMLSLVTFR